MGFAAYCACRASFLKHVGVARAVVVLLFEGLWAVFILKRDVMA